MTDQEIEEFMLEYCDLPPIAYHIENGYVVRDGKVIFNAKARRLVKIPIQFSNIKGIVDCSHLENVTDLSFIPLRSYPYAIKVYSSAQLNESFFKALLQRPDDGCGVVKGRYQIGTADENRPQPEMIYKTQAARFALTDFSRAALATVHKYTAVWYGNHMATDADPAPLQPYVAIAAPYTRNVRYSYVSKRYRLCFTKANNRYRLADYIGQVLYDYAKTQDFIALKAAVEGTRFEKYIETPAIATTIEDVTELF